MGLCSVQQRSSSDSYTADQPSILIPCSRPPIADEPLVIFIFAGIKLTSRTFYKSIRSIYQYYMESQELIATCESVIAKLQRKKQRIQEAQLKPKRLLRSRQSLRELQAKRFNNPLTSPENTGLIPYLPNQVRSSLLNVSKINVEMINQIKISTPHDEGQGLRNMKKAFRLFEQSIKSIPKLDIQKVIPSRSTIEQQRMEPQEAYTLYLADRIEELSNIGFSTPNNISEGKHTEFDHFVMKGIDDFYEFGSDRIF